MAYGNGFPPPEWMETFESIQAAARTYPSGIETLMTRYDGVVALSSVLDGVVVALEDRARGLVYYRCVSEQAIGEVIKRKWNCQVSYGVVHEWTAYMKLVRRVDVSEVRDLMTKNYAPQKIQDGYWYEVQVD